MERRRVRDSLHQTFADHHLGVYVEHGTGRQSARGTQPLAQIEVRDAHSASSSNANPARSDQERVLGLETLNVRQVSQTEAGSVTSPYPKSEHTPTALCCESASLQSTLMAESVYAAVRLPRLWPVRAAKSMADSTRLLADPHRKRRSKRSIGIGGEQTDLVRGRCEALGQQQIARPQRPRVQRRL